MTTRMLMTAYGIGFAAILAADCQAAGRNEVGQPDFTNGDKIPEGADHD